MGYFLSKQPALATKILKQAKAQLKDVAAVKSTRWALFKLLKTTGLPVTIGTDARTKFNRRRFDLPKEHWIDAACVGEIESLTLLTTQPLLVKATGHGCRQVIPMNKYGFPREGYKAKKPLPGWKTGDIVNVVSGKNAWLKSVRIKTVFAQGSFDIKPGDKIFSVSRNHIKPIHRQDGYGYSF